MRNKTKQKNNVAPEVSVSKPFASNLSWSELSGFDGPPRNCSVLPIDGGVLRQSDITRHDFAYWISKIKEVPKLNRKQWEYFIALQNLFSSNEARLEGLKGIGFGVGREPIPALLASLGMKIVATDYSEGPEAEAWRETNQLNSSIQDFNDRQICPNEAFESNFEYQELDMNQIPEHFNGQFDFAWSFCALGHIGGYWQGLEFIRNTARLLKPGGVSVHTTELDLSTNLPILDSPGLSLYRQTDLEELLEDLRNMGMVVGLHKFAVGPGIAENYIDYEPWSETHLRHDVLGHDVIPAAIVFRKPIN